MIQESFNFTLGESGDHDLILLNAEHISSRFLEDFKAGRMPAAMRGAVRLQKLCGLGSLVGAFVRDSVRFTDSVEDSVSTAEAWAEYQRQMNEHRQPTLTRGEFEKLMPAAMRQAHAVSRVNYIKGPGGRSVRGYMRCKLKSHTSK